MDYYFKSNNFFKMMWNTISFELTKTKKNYSNDVKFNII